MARGPPKKVLMALEFILHEVPKSQQVMVRAGSSTNVARWVRAHTNEDTFVPTTFRASPTIVRGRKPSGTPGIAGQFWMGFQPPCGPS